MRTSGIPIHKVAAHFFSENMILFPKMGIYKLLSRYKVIIFLCVTMGLTLEYMTTALNVGHVGVYSKMNRISFNVELEPK